MSRLDQSVKTRVARTVQCYLGVVAAALGLLFGCAAQNAVSTPPPADQNLLRQCWTSISAHVCPTAQDNTSQEQCLERQSAIYSERATHRSRRKWLLSNGCPLAIVNGGGTPAVARAATQKPAAPPVARAVADTSKSQIPTPRKDEPKPSPSGASASVVNAGFVATPPTPPALAAAPASTGDRAESSTTQPAVTSQTDPSSPKVSPLALGEPNGPRLRRGANAKQQLRAAIVAHEPEMKRCVDRQLKLVPTLRAAGTLVVDVDARGQVPRIILRGKDLTGSALEMCLRDAAVRWRFPRTGQAYSIEAPLVVSGVQGPS